LKIRLGLVSIFITLVLVGCAFHTTNYTIGKDFSQENIRKIEKGKTTTEQLVAMLGEPYTKSVISSDEVKWLYMYIHSSATARASLTPKVETSGIQKNLDILIKDDTVVNFAYTENLPASVNMR
jgi:hypothetical protein